MCRDWEVPVLRPSVALSEGRKGGRCPWNSLGQPRAGNSPHPSVPGSNVTHTVPTATFLQSEAFLEKRLHATQAWESALEQWQDQGGQSQKQPLVIPKPIFSRKFALTLLEGGN